MGIVQLYTLWLHSPVLFGAFGMFFMVYALGYLKLFRHWRPKDRAEAASCCISLAHGTPAALLAGCCMLKSPWKLAGQNTWFENAVMDFSIAYFLMDSVHYLVFFPGDFIFIAHHLATLFVMGSCRYYVGHGGLTVMSLLFVAELTSACQNAWTLARVARLESLKIAIIYGVLSPSFYSFYTCVRGFVAPVLTYHLAEFYLSGKADNVIPRWLSFGWISIITIAILASIAWILNLWVELFRYYARMRSDKYCIKTQ
eukprot:Gb_31736 [translate_table: standard]